MLIISVKIFIFLDFAKNFSNFKFLNFTGNVIKQNGINKLGFARARPEIISDKIFILNLNFVNF